MTVKLTRHRQSGTTLTVGRWMLMTARYTPTQRPKNYALRLYLNRNQIEIGIGDRGWTAVIIRRSQDMEAVKKARLAI